jgi:hypothetical protein
MYKELAALYKEFEAEVEALAERINARVREIDPERKVCDFISPSRWVQLYADKPSEGAKYSFTSDTGTKFYDSWVDGVQFVEMIENDKS